MFFSYSYDAENRLIAAYPISSVVGALAVENRYDHRHRRIQKVVKSFDGEGAVVTQLPRAIVVGDFAYRTFKRHNEAKGNAAVHCVIKAYGLSPSCTDADRVAHLFKLYAEKVKETK